MRLAGRRTQRRESRSHPQRCFDPFFDRHSADTVDLSLPRGGMTDTGAKPGERSLVHHGFYMR